MHKYNANLYYTIFDRSKYHGCEPHNYDIVHKEHSKMALSCNCNFINNKETLPENRSTKSYNRI